MTSFKAFWQLTRADHAIALFVGVLIGAVLGAPSLDAIPRIALLLAALSPAFQWMGITTAGDIWDYATDKANKRTDRPLVTGEVHKSTAAATAFVTITLSIILAWLASHLAGNYWLLLVASVYGILGILYSHTIKRWPLGTAIVALGMALPYPFGNLIVSGTISTAAWLIAGAAFCFGMGRELVKSIMDYEGDRKTGRRTFPILVGIKPAAGLSIAFLFAAIGLLLSPFFFLDRFTGDFLFLAIALAATIVTAEVIMDTALLRGFKRSRKLTLIASFLALIAFLVGAIV